MGGMEADAAPAPKPGSDEPDKIWEPALGALVQTSGEGEGAEEASAEGDFDETDMFTVVHNNVPPCFFERDAYRVLHNKGLTSLPEGFKLSYHTVSCQWHGRWDAVNKNFAPSWGNLRSELKALILTLIQIWEWHLSVCPDDNAAIGHLENLRAIDHETVF